MDEVVDTMVNLKKITSTLSNAELPPHVHSEMNELLTHLSKKKDFDFCQLGAQLCSVGPLGKDIVVCTPTHLPCLGVAVLIVITAGRRQFHTVQSTVD